MRFSPRALGAVLVAVTSIVLGATGCGSDPPTFPPVRLDAGARCTPGGPAMDGGGSMAASGCSASEICLSGRCFARCTGAAQCASGEACSPDGACLPRSGPVPDGGRTDSSVPEVDAGPTGPCATVSCTAPMTCHPATGGCVACFDDPATQCGGGSPICDIASGTCAPFVAGVCAPCNNDRDCDMVVAGFTATCVTSASPIERVCLAQCDASMMCPRGLRCDSSNNCVPTAGSCTGFFAAQRARTCATDADCAPLGAPPSAIVAGSCNGTMCIQSCTMDGDCTGGATCPSSLCM